MSSWLAASRNLHTYVIRSVFSACLEAFKSSSRFMRTYSLMFLNRAATLTMISAGLLLSVAQPQRVLNLTVAPQSICASVVAITALLATVLSVGNSTLKRILSNGNSMVPSAGVIRWHGPSRRARTSQRRLHSMARSTWLPLPGSMTRRYYCFHFWLRISIQPHPVPRIR